jgi:hypothetical protein
VDLVHTSHMDHIARGAKALDDQVQHRLLHFVIAQD